MNRRALLSLIGALSLAGCGGRSDDTTPTETSPTRTQEITTATTRQDEPALELVEHELTRSNEGSESELVIVSGTVRNAGDELVTGPVVTATFQQADGETLGSATTDAPELSADATWSFEVVYPHTGEDARTIADYTLTVQVNE